MSEAGPAPGPPAAFQASVAPQPAGAPGGPAAPILLIENLVKTYRVSNRPNTVINDVSFSVRRGEFVAVMGPSGCGKSTLLHLLAGLDAPDSGRVVIDGHDLTAMSERDRTVFRREHIGFVFQFFNLIPNLTAAENIALPLRIAGGRGSSKDRVGDLMRDLNLRNLQGHRPEEISGGEQQRVAIARALLMQPALLMADEPTGNLDYTTGREVLDLVFSRCEAGQTAILATHDARAAAYAERVLVMRDGRIVDSIDLGHRDDHNASALIARLALLGL